MLKKKSLKERLLAKVQYTDTGCWIWTGYVLADGYGQIASGEAGKIVRTHRASYMIFKGPIPEGMVIDHLCRNRSCFNPDHLEVVTVKENILRGESPPIKIRRSGYCKHGHEINKINTRFDTKTGHIRECRICKHETRRRQRQTRKQNGGAA